MSGRALAWKTRKRLTANGRELTLMTVSFFIRVYSCSFAVQTLDARADPAETADGDIALGQTPF